MTAPDVQARDVPPSIGQQHPRPGIPRDGTVEAGNGAFRPSTRPADRRTEPEIDLAAEIDQLPLGDVQKAYLRDRWLEQVGWLGRGARRDQRRYYALRLVSILGGVTIPALVGLNIGSDADSAVRWLTFGLGLLVAAATALEEFFRYGERWRHYRQQAELLKAEGWAFLQLAGPAYRRFDAHADAFRTFVGRVEDAVRQEVGVYIAEVARASDRQETDERNADGRARANRGQAESNPLETT